MSSGEIPPEPQPVFTVAQALAVVRDAARILADGSAWTVTDVIRSPDGDVEAQLRHKRGDALVVRMDAGFPVDAMLVAIDNAMQEELPFPNWKRGDPIPSYTVMLEDLPEPPEPGADQEALAEYERLMNDHPVMTMDVGQSLTIVAIDRDNATFTLRPGYGPWDLPETP